MKKWGEVLDYAVKLNKKYKNYPVWGTCLGFESIVYKFSNYNIPTTEVDSLNTNHRLIWKKTGPGKSLIKKELRKSVMASLAKGNFFLNFFR